MRYFMVVEHYKEGKAAEIYARFSQNGRMLPPGVEYVNSWISEDLKTCYQIMMSETTEQLNEWVRRWNDLVDFEVVPVIDSQAAAQLAQER